MFNVMQKKKSKSGKKISMSSSCGNFRIDYVTAYLLWELMIKIKFLTTNNCNYSNTGRGNHRTSNIHSRWTFYKCFSWKEWVVLSGTFQTVLSITNSKRFVWLREADDSWYMPPGNLVVQIYCPVNLLTLLFMNLLHRIMLIDFGESS